MLSALIIALLGGILQRRHIAIFASCAAATAFLTVLLVWLDSAAASQPLQQTLYTWMTVSDWRPTIGLTLDRLALTMVSVVSGVGLLIHIYSITFMADDSDHRRYYFFLNLFLGGMLLLVLADNLLLLYLGWELVGLCSFALIGFWYQDPVRASAGRKAFITTRIGDMSLALGIFLLFSQFNELSLSTLLVQASEQWDENSQLATFTALLILGGAVGKSAQIPLQIWLPDAMAGPSPVSALIHAATMVTAGVYLIARTYPLFELAPQVQWAVAAIGALTIIYGASAALAQSDFKRVLAYSTISQIGYMFLALGCGAYAFALFHLVTHAFFKSLLFLTAGAVIQASGHEHDIHRLGKLGNHPPLARWAFLIGAASLAGIPFITAGFYSKEAILTATWPVSAGPLLWTVAAIGALITGVYIFRVYFLVFKNPQPSVSTPTITGTMTWPLLILALLSIVGGFVEFPAGWPGLHLWSAWLEDEFGSAVHPPLSTVYALQFAASLLPLLGIGIALFLVRREQTGSSTRPLMVFLRNGWEFDKICKVLLVDPYFKLTQLFKTMEAHLIERTLRSITREYLFFANYCRLGLEHGTLSRSIRGILTGLHFGHTQLSATQNGMLSRYALMICAGAVFLLSYWLW